MNGSTRPNFKCKRSARTYNRFRTNKSKYCKMIINNFYIGNQFININNANINQYNYNNNQFNNGTHENDRFDKSLAIDVNSTDSSTGYQFKQLENKFSESDRFAKSLAADVNSTKSSSGYQFKQLENKLSESDKLDKSLAIDVNSMDSSPGYQFKQLENKLSKDIISRKTHHRFSDLKRFEMVPQIPSFSFENLPSKMTVLNSHPDKFNLCKISGPKSVPALDHKNLLGSSPSNDCSLRKDIKPYLPYYSNKVKDNALNDITNKSPKILNLDVNYLMLNSTPNLLNEFKKCIRMDSRKNKKLKKKKVNGLFFKFCSKKEMASEEAAAQTENNSVSSGTSTPLREKTSSKGNWELSPIYTYEKRHDLQDNLSQDFSHSENASSSVHANDITKYLFELTLDEKVCEKSKAKEELNYSVKKSYNFYNIKNISDEDDCKTLAAFNAEENVCLDRCNLDHSDDIFESFSVDKIESFTSDSKLSSSDGNPQSLLCDSPQERLTTIDGNSCTDDKNFLKDCMSHNKTSISTNIDFCDFHSLRSSGRFDDNNSDSDSFNFSFVCCSENLENRSEQFFRSPNTSQNLECYSKIIPGKRWRRSLSAARKKNRSTYVYRKDLNVSLTSGWKIRLSLNPQNNNHSSIKTYSRRTSILQIKKLQEIKEQSPTKNKETQQQTDASHDVSLPEFDSFKRGVKVDEEESNEEEEEPAGELDFTFVIHRQVANILQKDDLNKTLLSVSPDSEDHKRYAKENVLNMCGLASPLNFCDAYSENFFRFCKKIGEGMFGEVFCYVPPRSEGKTVLKIIPIEGDKLVNFSYQKTYSEVFSEMCIAFSLSSLKNNINGYYTDGFCSLLRMTCLKGKYPPKLVKLWNEYDKIRKSENDSPIMFDSEQLYIALEMLNGGEPLECYQFSSARQSHSILLQVIHSLAVAEKAFEFEHRDLHWGNVLVSKTYKTKIKYIIDGISYYVPSFGKKSTIIDYTLSRIRSGNFDIYNDISKDEELFEAFGDIQFDVYRGMRDDVKNNWQSYVPKTNVRWIHYLAVKCYKGVHYKADHNIHKSYLIKIKRLRDIVLNYSSAADIVKDLNNI